MTSLLALHTVYARYHNGNNVHRQIKHIHFEVHSGLLFNPYRL
jgi:hypothetical protein